MTDAPDNLPAVRVGDIDREVAAKQLQLAVDEGLDLLDQDKRLVAVYSAQTAQELVAITADMPAIAAAYEPIPAPPDRLTVPRRPDGIAPPTKQN